MLESTTKFTGERHEVGILCKEPEPNLLNNYSSAFGQLYSLEQRFQRDPNLKSLYQQSIDTDVEKKIRKDIGRIRSERRLRERMVFATPSSALKRVGLDNEEEYPIAAKAIPNNFYIDDFIKSVETPGEPIEFFNQLQPFLSQHGFELKKWISNNDAVTKAIPANLNSISNTKQVEAESNTEGSSVLGLQWTVTDDSLQVCRGTNKEVEAPITESKILSLVSSVFDPIGLFAPLSVHMRPLLKGIWTKNGKHWGNEVEPGDKAEFLRWKEQLPIVAETSIERRYFNRERDKTDFHVFADASEDMMCAVAYLRLQLREYSADLANVIENAEWHR